MSKMIIQIGRPIHLRLYDRKVTACGLVGEYESAYDPRDVECLNCRKTKAYYKAINGGK